MASKQELEVEVQRLKSQIANGGKTKGRTNPAFVLSAKANPDGTHTVVFNLKLARQMANPNRPIKRDGTLSKIAWTDGNRGSWIGFGPGDPNILLIQPALAMEVGGEVSVPVNM